MKVDFLFVLCRSSDMERQVCFLLLLLAVLNSASAGREKRYRAVGDTLIMAPPHSGPITNILWKHNGNLVAEWLSSELQYYGKFKDRTTLDTTTAHLKITDMREADSGLYTVEINFMAQDQKYDVKVIKKVFKVPDVRARSLTCASDSKSCDLICNGDTTGTEPVTYSWKTGDGGWITGGKIMTIKNDEETRGIETFSCQMKNPVSEEDSDPYKNPFFQRGLPDSGSWTNVLGVVIRSLASLGLLGAVIFFFFFWKKRNYQETDLSMSMQKR
ncbi:LOW QUALITY PROTEIN: natural killer cell receptor 2B4-like [Toxotes jaculatrix]|uniref:LOW QUALITY PROTEIN: natural killer cell receptor 2B4-like n=1 Tax=Toxotes jaculatrix TaxID=941984 RepID=UPI001B3ACC8B|nr:LOW QUALITY PROTEIN: natural killer cell receptor 2B4-like [Toxotes jaculatrix]